MGSIKMQKEELQIKLREKRARELKELEEIRAKGIESDKHKVSKLQIRVTVDERDYIQNLAKLNNMNTSEYIRNLIQRYADEILKAY